jgi:hypothetical protein
MARLDRIVPVLMVDSPGFIPGTGSTQPREDNWVAT